MIGLGVTVTLGLASACGSQTVPDEKRVTTTASVGNVFISSARVLAPVNGTYPAGGDATVDLAISNTGQIQDTLDAVSSPASSTVALVVFGSVQKQATIPAQGSQKTSVLVQLSHLNEQLKPGQSLQLSLTFRRAGAVSLSVPVQTEQTVSPSG